MSKWLMVVLGIVVSAAIFVGIAAFVLDSHPLRDYSVYRQRDACVEKSRYSDSGVTACYDRLERRDQSTRQRETWLAVGAGAAGVGIFWLLVYFLYIRPRRQRDEGASMAM